MTAHVKEKMHQIKRKTLISPHGSTTTTRRRNTQEDNQVVVVVDHDRPSMKKKFMAYQGGRGSSSF